MSERVSNSNQLSQGRRGRAAFKLDLDSLLCSAKPLQDDKMMFSPHEFTILFILLQNRTGIQLSNQILQYSKLDEIIRFPPQTVRQSITRITILAKEIYHPSLSSSLPANRFEKYVVREVIKYGVETVCRNGRQLSRH